jgi:hypothetical protein
MARDKAIDRAIRESRKDWQRSAATAGELR